MPRRSRLRIIGAAFVAAGVLTLVAGKSRASPVPAADEGWHYEFGQGLRLGSSGVTLGGYLTAEVNRLDGARTQLRASHASLFVFWEPVEGWKLLAEVDQQNAVVNVRARGRIEGFADRRTSLERLHATYTVSDALALRAGKFLTPVGRWNLQHADPLVWTTSRPLLTLSAYPRNVTGAMASGAQPVGEQLLNWAVYAANGHEWRPDPLQDQFAQVRGGRLTLPLSGAWLLGASYARYEQAGSRGERRSLQGLDAAWSRDGWELSAEWLKTRTTRAAPMAPPGGPGGAPQGLVGSSDVNRPQQRPLAVGGAPPAPPPDNRFSVLGRPTQGAYLQAVAPLVPGLFAVARVERYRDTALPTPLRSRVLGVAWRPAANWSLKAELQAASGRPDLAVKGWSASASVLF